MTAGGLLCPACQRESSSGRFCRGCGAELSRHDGPQTDRGAGSLDGSRHPSGISANQTHAAASQHSQASAPPTATVDPRPREPAQTTSANGSMPVAGLRPQTTPPPVSQSSVEYWPPRGWESMPGAAQQIPPSWPMPQWPTGPPPERPRRSPALAVAATTAILLIMLALAATVILLVANGDSRESRILTRPSVATTATEGAR